MKKRKKKNSTNQLRHNEKQDRREYLLKLKDFCSQINAGEVYDLLTEREKDMLFHCHGRIKIQFFNCSDWTREHDRDFYTFIRNLLQKTTIYDLPEGITLSCFDYFYYLQVLMFIIKERGPKILEHLPDAEILRLDEEELFKKYCCTIGFSLYMEALILTDLKDVISKIVFEPVVNNTESFKGETVYISVILFAPVRKQIKLKDNTVRTGIQLQSALEPEKFALKDITISLSQLNIDNKFADLPLKVYATEHAWNRMGERINILDSEIPPYEIMVDAFAEPVCVRNKKGDLLLEVDYIHEKVGYFLLEVADGVALIKTCLFITNNSTPEGEKLNEITGLRKEDKKYLLIDNLKDFMSSDILKDEEACALFRKAGCQSLLDICGKLDELDVHSILNIKRTNLASKLLSYIKPA